ncbi:hypothetical protein TKK_0015491 [Trichogramma kaykai]
MQWLLLQEAVMGEMDKIDGESLPEFGKPLPWEGAKLKVVSLEALKKPHKAIITVPGRLKSKTPFQRIALSARD